jgi:sulfide dehydrogenase [flavocytochrome c] flavoprotein chain
MHRLNRRQFAVAASGAGIGVLARDHAFSAPALAQGPGRVVVIGGGPGGATVASRLKAAKADLDVTLIEPKSQYACCFYSNTYLGGFRSFASLTHSYDGVRKRGVRVITDAATVIEPQLRTVRLANSDTPVPYDRLVVAPGIEIKFDSVDGYSEQAAEIMPHAWTGGAQTWLLKKRLLAMPDGGTVVMTVPPNPYRCPPGPYERACMIAHVLKAVKPRSKLILFDAKSTFSKQSVFEEAFQDFYKDIIEINLTNEIDDYAVERVDAASGEVLTRAGRREIAALANVIPAQRAGRIAERAGLTDGDWCPVDPANFNSTKVPGIYVLGDAALASDMPKSAFAAMSQATVVAADIIADLNGGQRPAGQFRNTCWSMLAPSNSVKIGADYEPADVKGIRKLEAKEAFISAAGETAAQRAETHAESFGWYESAVADVFGSHVKEASPAGP